MSTPFISSAGSAAPHDPRLVSSKKMSALLFSIAGWITVALAVLVPLAACTATSQPLESIKQAMLMAGATLAILAWIGGLLIERTIVLRRTVANVVVLLYLAAIAAAALFSTSRYVSLVGDYGQEYQSLITTALFVLVFFVIVHGTGRTALVHRLLVTTIGVGGLISLLALLQYAGVRVIPSLTSGTFNFVGSTVNLGLYAAITVVLASGYLLTEATGRLALISRMGVAFAGVFALLIAIVIDFRPVWITAIVGILGLLLYALVRPEAIRRLTWLAVPMGALIIGVLFLFINVPSPVRAPSEVFPSLKQTVSIVRDTLSAHPVLGTGPGTFTQDFAQYRDRGLNQSALWYLRFDRGASHLLTLSATAGFAGLVTWLAVIIVGLWKSAAFLIRSKNKDDHRWVLTAAVTAGWIAAATATVVYGASLTVLFTFWLLFALTIRLTASELITVKFESSPRSALTMTFAFVIVVVLALAGWFVTGTRLYADTLYVKASQRDASKEGDKLISELERASKVNPQSDLIARNLSQAYLFKIQSLFADQKLDASTRGAQVQTLTATAVRAARRAVELTPEDVAGWAQLGTVYGAIAPFVTNASEEAIKAYARAAELEPASPVHPTETARVHMASAERATSDRANAKDEAAKVALQKVIDENLMRASESLGRALALKPDYAVASFQLALVLERQGKAKEAIAKLEEVRRGAPNDTGVGLELGLLYYRSNQKDKAREEFERVVGLNPTFSNARWFLSIVYEEQNKLAEAIAQVEEIVRANPDNETAAARLKNLQDKKAGIIKTPASAATPLPEGQTSGIKPPVKK